MPLSPWGALARFSFSVLFLTLAGPLPVSAQPLAWPRDYVKEVLRGHPAVGRAVRLVESAEFAMRAGGLQPNPQITLAATAGDAGESSNALTQSFEISGQPALRREVGALRWKAAHLELRATRRRVAAQAYRVWLQLWRAQRLADLSLLQMTLLEETLRAANRRYEVGEIAQNEALRVELAAAQARADVANAQADLQTAHREWELLLNAGDRPGNQQPSVLTAQAPPPLLEADRDVTVARVLEAVAEHPRVRALELERQAATLGADVIAKETAPVLSFSVYRADLFRTAGVEQGAQLAVSWPIVDWGGIESRRRAQLAEAEARRCEIENAVLERRREVSRLWYGLQAARTNRDILLSQAERYEELAREGRVAYDLGLVSLTDALQTEASFRAAGVRLVEAQAKVMELEVGLLESTGLSWPGVTPETEDAI